MRTAVITSIVSTLLLACACGDAGGPVVTSADSIPDAAIAADAVRGCVVLDGIDASGDVTATHRVSRGESLSSIAREVYGDADLWQEIARANPELVGPNGSVQIGALLAIPFAGR